MRILAIDYGAKRTGLAVTDPLQIIVSPLIGLDTKDLKRYLKQYLANEKVQTIILGLPLHSDGTPTQLMGPLNTFKAWIENELAIPVEWHEESFTSQKAAEIIRKSGAKQKKRRDKKLLDMVSAVVILQEYLGHT